MAFSGESEFASRLPQIHIK